jgi:hypothetical protein
MKGVCANRCLAPLRRNSIVSCLTPDVRGRGGISHALYGKENAMKQHRLAAAYLSRKLAHRLTGTPQCGKAIPEV